MSRPSSSRGTDATVTSRRRYLAGLASGFAGVGTVAGTASAGRSDTWSTERGPSGNDPTERDVRETDRRATRKRALPPSDEVEAVTDEVLGRRVGDTVPGAAICVVEGEETVLSKGYGYADAEAGTPVDASETGFRLGSVGKLLTWTAVMSGVESGVLDLDADVNTYLEDTPVSVPTTKYGPVTLRHLGTHTAGFESSLSPGIVDDPNEVRNLEPALVDRRPDRVRPPGELVGYSNYGAALAGHVVAAARDTSFSEVVRSAVLDPLGMDHTTFRQPVPDDYPGTLAAPHVGGDGFETVDPVFVELLPAGSTTATADDVARFLQAHIGDGSTDTGRVLAPDTLARMHTEQFVRHPAVTNWRYGFHEYGPPDSGWLSHSGGTVYFESRLVVHPEREVGVFLNYNTRGAEAPATVIDELLDRFGLLSEPSPPSSSTPASNEEARRRRASVVAGEYRGTTTPESGPLELLDYLSRLTVEPGGTADLTTSTLDGDREWTETEPFVYRATDGYDVLAFDVTDGKVTAVHRNSVPQGSYVPVERVGERGLPTAALVGGSLVGFAGSLVARTGRRVWHSLAGTDDDSRGDES